MKKFLSILIITFLFCSSITKAQDVIDGVLQFTDNSSQPITAPVGVQVVLHSGTITGNVLGVEAQTITPDVNGIAKIQIGSVNTSLFNNIDFSSQNVFYEIKADYSGGTNYVSQGGDVFGFVPNSNTAVKLKVPADMSGTVPVNTDYLLKLTTTSGSGSAMLVMPQHQSSGVTVYSDSGDAIQAHTSNGVAINAISNSSNHFAGIFYNNGSSNGNAIQTVGKVGINTTSPTELLDVNGAIKIGSSTLSSPVSAGTIRYNTMGNIFEGYTSGGWIAFNGSGGANYWTLTGNNISNNNSANIGIGNNSPAYKLDVKENSVNAATAAYFLNGTASTNFPVTGTSSLWASSSTGNAIVGVSDNAAAIVGNSSSNIGVNGNATAAGGTGGRFIGVSGAYALTTGGGNVGIGTTTPTYPLDVNGNTRIMGTLKVGSYTLPSADGTNGQMLSTNGSGTVSWVNGGGGSSQWTTSGSNIYYNTGGVQINQSFSTGAKLEVRGGFITNVSRFTITGNGMGGYGVRAIDSTTNNGGGTNAAGLYASSISGAGVYATSSSGSAISCNSATGNALDIGDGIVSVGNTLSNTSVLFKANIKFNISSVGSNYTVVAKDNYIVATASVNITLPNAIGNTGSIKTIKRSTSAGLVTVNTTAGQTIDGSSTYNLSNNNDFITVISDGANWQIVAK